MSRTRRFASLSAQARKGGCFYCERKDVELEADHAPVPWRHGNASDVLPACHRCHALKDRKGFDDWDWPDFAAATSVAHMPSEALALISSFTEAIEGSGATFDPADVLSAAESCTSPMTRIAVMKTYCIALDVTAGACLRDPVAA